MSDVHVEEPHNTTPADAITKVAAFEDMLKKYGVKATWAGQKADLKGIGVKGTILVDAAKVVVDLHLGMVARAAGIDATKLGNSIRKRLRAAFDG